MQLFLYHRIVKNYSPNNLDFLTVGLKKKNQHLYRKNVSGYIRLVLIYGSSSLVNTETISMKLVIKNSCQ